MTRFQENKEKLLNDRYMLFKSMTEIKSSLYCIDIFDDCIITVNAFTLKRLGEIIQYEIRFISKRNRKNGVEPRTFH